MAESSSPSVLVERVGQRFSVQAALWPRGQPAEPGVVVVADSQARTAPVVSLLVQATEQGRPAFRALVHGYGCSCAEEVELWERPGLVLVGLGQAVTVLDGHTGQVRLRIPMGAYFNSLWVAEDGRDAFVCSDEQVIRLVPPGVQSWHKSLGVDGVLVHRAVGHTVFVSVQRKVGGGWVDYLLDRMTGAVVEAPDADDDAEPAPAAKPATGQKDAAAAAKPGAKPAAPAKPEPPADNQEDEAARAVRLVRDDESEPDDE